MPIGHLDVVAESMSSRDQHVSDTVKKVARLTKDFDLSSDQPKGSSMRVNGIRGETICLFDMDGILLQGIRAAQTIPVCRQPSKSSQVHPPPPELLSPGSMGVKLKPETRASLHVWIHTVEPQI